MRFLTILIFIFALSSATAVETTTARVREQLVKTLLTEDAGEQSRMIQSLATEPYPVVAQVLNAWRQGSVFLHERPDQSKTPFLLDSVVDAQGKSKSISIVTGNSLTNETGQALSFAPNDLTPLDTSSKLRKAIKTTLDLLGMANPNPKMRRAAILKLAMDQNADFLPFFESALGREKQKEPIKALQEAIAITQLASQDAAVRDAAVTRLGTMNSIEGISFLKQLYEAATKTAPEAWKPASLANLRESIRKIDNYAWWGTMAGTFFRGLSLSAVLLVIALGLAITFGLMGVINMAHGEIMMIGAYTAYVIQSLFGNGFAFSIFGKTMTVSGWHLKGASLDSYFLVALPASFVICGLVGLLLERGVIRFLYSRPLESLLATWGVSLVLQQFIRGTFGPANVQMNSPGFLSGSFAWYDVLFAFNRLFVLGFAVFVVLLTYLLLTKTSWGLQVRAVMQNRRMASCVGVRTEKINMMTFAFGCGLAGMAGACLSQIGNVGPSMGQSYIVDCFMIVTVGGVGNLVGTITAALGVGVIDQILQPFLGAVLGKIVLLGAIILFLQWRPAGLFVTKSRGLEG